MSVRFIAVCLFALLLCHSLAQCIVGVVDWWQAEHDLSERLTVYRSTDSLLEFQIALKTPTDGSTLARTTEDGFRYRGRDYGVVSLESVTTRCSLPDSKPVATHSGPPIC